MTSLVPPATRKLGYLAGTALTSSSLAATRSPSLPRSQQPQELQRQAQPVNGDAETLSIGTEPARRVKAKRRRVERDDGDHPFQTAVPRLERALPPRAPRQFPPSTFMHPSTPSQLPPIPPSLHSAPSPNPRSAAILSSRLAHRPPVASRARPNPSLLLESDVRAAGAAEVASRRTFLTFRTAKKRETAEDKGATMLVQGDAARKGAGTKKEPPVPAEGTISNEKAGSSSSSSSEQQGTDKRRSPHGTSFSPRPASPYGELNILARHPTLHNPLIKPRFPIVLCHGLYGFDVRGPGFFRLHYWGDLLKILRGQIGAEVFVTAVPGTGSVKNRAQVLHKALNETPALLNRDVNFLAHSMGGLDARYLISNIRPSLYNPRSLTTLCTPHRGSEFMAWCRANIGIGTEFDQNEALDLRPTSSSSLDEPDDASIPLPYSLKSPILSREQVEAAKKAARADAMAERVKAAATSLLPFNLSVSVTSYLLDLLDSPAYANLTPSFLRDVFNPSTPDLDSVKYYSVAARTEKIPIWHPLWLPKLVLDGAEAARIAKGVAAPPEWRGNDGLVSIDSARWGEFLGTFDACDHWEMRGSSGLISKEASKAAVAEMSRSEIRETKEPQQGGKAEKVGGGGDAVDKKEKGSDDGWQWQDVYASVAHSVGGGEKETEGGVAAVESKTKNSSDASTTPLPTLLSKTPSDDHNKHCHDAQGLASAASWIVRQLPGSSSSSSDPSTPILSPRGRAALQSAESSLSAVTSAASSVGSAATSAASTVVDNVMHNRATRLLYGAPGLSSSASSDAEKRAETETSASGGKEKAGYQPPSKPEKFSLEQMTVAICRKLYNNGF